MRKPASLLALVLSLASIPVEASDPAEPSPTAPPEQHTVVRGTPPRGVAGRWMAVGWIELPDQRARSVVAFWEITREKDQPVLTVRFAAFPPEQGKALEDANTAEKPWRPGPDDIARLAAAWDALTSSDPHLVSIQNEIVAHDGFDDSFTREPKTRDAVWVVRQVEKYHPSAAPAIQTINVYAVLEPRDGGYFGNFTTATMAAAPLPIPIMLNGTFQMYRLGGGSSPSRGFFRRLMDTLQGCRRG